MNSNIFFGNLFDYIESTYLGVGLAVNNFDIVVNPTYMVFNKLIIINYPIEDIFNYEKLCRFNQVESRFYINDRIRVNPYETEICNPVRVEGYNDLVITDRILRYNLVKVADLEKSILGINEYWNGQMTAIGYQINNNLTKLQTK